VHHQVIVNQVNSYFAYSTLIFDIIFVLYQENHHS